jgi:predicted nucleic acid-binding protein
VIAPTISIYEVFRRILQQRSEGEALQAIAVLTQGQEVELDTTLALSAAKMSAELGLPMADSVMLATARAYDAVLWTQDAHFKDIEGVQYVEKR